MERHPNAGPRSLEHERLLSELRAKARELAPDQVQEAVARAKVEAVEKLLLDAERKNDGPMQVVLNGEGRPVATISRQSNEPQVVRANRRQVRVLRAEAKRRARSEARAR